MNRCCGGRVWGVVFVGAVFAIARKGSVATVLQLLGVSLMLVVSLSVFIRPILNGGHVEPAWVLEVSGDPGE
jgi:hypothetical protein